MTKLNEYFDNELSAQEQLEIQMWLAEHGDSPDSEAQLAELFDSLHIDDDAAARAAFGRVAHRLGIAGGQPSAPSRRARIVAWSQRIAASCAPSGCSTPTASRRRNGSNSRFRTAKWPP